MQWFEDAPGFAGLLGDLGGGGGGVVAGGGGGRLALFAAAGLVLAGFVGELDEGFCGDGGFEGGDEVFGVACLAVVGAFFDGAWVCGVR